MNWLFLILRFFRAKGGYFWLNALWGALAVYLTLPLFGHVSTVPLLYHYSLKYLVYLLVHVLLITLFLAAIVAFDRRINRYIFFTTAFLILSLEISVRVIFEDGLGKQNTF